ncbi:MAG: 50S ribosomal protein L4 [Chlamydia sp.]
MASLKKYTIQGHEMGVVQVSDELHEATVHSQLIKDYIIAIRHNARQWSANTKRRHEVNHSTKKPHPQKGQGRARQGSLAATQYKGGGRPKGPKPKFDQHIRINQKEKRLAIKALLAEKIREGRVIILDSTAMEVPKTKVMQNFLDVLGMEKRVLILGEGSFVEIGLPEVAHKISIRSDLHENMKKSLRNIPGVSFMCAMNTSGYDMALAQHVVVTESAFKELEEWLV